ncbi:hypothetical protein CRYUN_Cryun04dG0135500 [Craigia yunnanensis]
MEAMEILLESVEGNELENQSFMVVGMVIADKILNRRGVIAILRGRLMEVEDPKLVEGGGRGFLRVKVAIKVASPLVDGFWVPRKDKERAWASVRYEKLFDFCFACGKLCHIWKNYDKEIECCLAASTKQRYGAHMWAGPRKR